MIISVTLPRNSLISEFVWFGLVYCFCLVVYVCLFGVFLTVASKTTVDNSVVVLFNFIFPKNAIQIKLDKSHPSSIRKYLSFFLSLTFLYINKFVRKKFQYFSCTYSKVQAKPSISKKLHFC